MHSIRLHLSALRPVRFLVAACICALLMLSHAVPAYSAPINPTGTKTAPQEGEAQLRGIEREAQEAVLKDPYSRQEMQAKTSRGLNEVQGDADIDKMNRPGNSQAASSVEDKVKQTLEAIKGKVNGTPVRSVEDVTTSVDRAKSDNTSENSNIARLNPTGTRTAPQQGEAQLRGIEREAQEAVLKDPYSRQEMQAKTSRGLNEVQGDADINKMSRPENSQAASSVEDKVKQALEAVKGKVTP